MTSATLGDDDASVETLKTADTSATMERSGSNGGRKGGTAITDGERNVTPPAARKRGVRDGASAAAGRASRAVSEVDVAIPAMPTPPAMAAKDIQLRTVRGVRVLDWYFFEVQSMLPGSATTTH